LILKRTSGSFFILCVCVIWCNPGLFAQFSLVQTSADHESIDLFVPGGNIDRQLLIRNDSSTLRIIDLENCISSCTLRIDSLLTATPYQVSLILGADTLSFIWSITASISTGLTKVYFTTSIDDRPESPIEPDGLGGDAIESAIIQHIDEAQFTIDVALYNINRRNIVNALIEAHNRGVRVRYVTGDDTANSALSNPTPPFFILQGNLGAPLMHHKFFVIDYQDPLNAWVITGATNTTTNQLFTDHNDLIMIQDQSLATVYTMEMNEMWGDTTSVPNFQKSRFGEFKSDNTPHRIFISGTLFESYFSPSDQTTFQIVNALNRAEHDVYFALLVFTRSNLANTLINLKSRGLKVRGMINNSDDSGSEFQRLLSNGVFVLDYSEGPQLHHKYAIIDPYNNGVVITGSHNWTNNAELRNDENTLIIHDPWLAQLYMRSFQARWCEAFRAGDCLLSSDHQYSPLNTAASMLYNNAKRSLMCNGLQGKIHALHVYSMNGAMVYGMKNMGKFAASDQGDVEIPIPNLVPGQYAATLYTSTGLTTCSFVVY
jgi:phosphatidylserine/phosphatidylglycerophosphate/cardiolipin synthase-like enzyme